nr:permease [Mycobacterium uberis]
MVLELGTSLALLMGWQFNVAEFVDGPLMIIILAVSFRLFVHPSSSMKPANGPNGEPPARWKTTLVMDMSIREAGSFWQRLCSLRKAFSHAFVMKWLAILRDLVLGLLIA